MDWDKLSTIPPRPLIIVLGIFLGGFALSLGQLTSESVQEGPCLDPVTVPDKDVWLFVSIVQIF